MMASKRKSKGMERSAAVPKLMPAMSLLVIALTKQEEQGRRGKSDSNNLNNRNSNNSRLLTLPIRRWLFPHTSPRLLRLLRQSLRLGCISPLSRGDDELVFGKHRKKK